MADKIEPIVKRAFKLAEEHKHQYVTLEHLLHSNIPFISLKFEEFLQHVSFIVCVCVNLSNSLNKLSLFISNAITNASKYVTHCGRNGVSKIDINYDGTRAVDGGEGKFREGISSGGKAIKFRCFINKDNSKNFPHLTNLIESTLFDLLSLYSCLCYLIK